MVGERLRRSGVAAQLPLERPTHGFHDDRDEVHDDVLDLVDPVTVRGDGAYTLGVHEGEREMGRAAVRELSGQDRLLVLGG